jgi:hypothetical protein
MPRPKGLPKTGGRTKGVQNQRTRKLAEDAAADGITPIEFLLNVMRDETHEFHARLDAAKAAAPYIHPRLTSVEATVSHDLGSMDDDDLDRAIADAAAQAGAAGVIAGESTASSEEEVL